MHYLGILFRVLFIFVALLATSRIIGKRFDVLAGYAVGGMAGIFVLQGAIPLSDGIVALLLWGLFILLTNFIAIKSPGFQNAIVGKPTILVEQGTVLEKNMGKSRLSISDMMSMLRQKNAFKLSDVEFAVLETDGQVSVMKKSELEPVSAMLAGLPVESESTPHIVIADGQVIRQTLLETGFTEGWLLGELMKQGAQDYTDVFLAQVDSKGNLYVDLYQDVLKPAEVKAKPLLLSSLKKLAVDLETYALQTENTDAQHMYSQQAKRLQAVVHDLQSYLRG